MQRAARVGDSTKGGYTSSHCPHPRYNSHGHYIGKRHPGGTVNGTVKSGSPNVFINGSPAARVGDKVSEKTSPNCTSGTGVIVSGSKKVFINGKPAARMSDSINEHTDRGGTITGGSSNVFIG